LRAKAKQSSATVIENWIASSHSLLAMTAVITQSSPAKAGDSVFQEA
jgi:hypothetical protein